MKKMFSPKPKPEPTADAATTAVMVAVKAAEQPDAPKRKMTWEEVRNRPLPAKYRTRYFHGGN